MPNKKNPLSTIPLLHLFMLAMAAGICIAIGGAIFLASADKTAGAIFFTVGLFTIVNHGFYLFTGKASYLLENDAQYAARLPMVWLGNLCGAILVALALQASRSGAALAEKAQSLCQAKVDDSLISLFFLGIFCNMLIFVAVDGYAKIEHGAGKILALIFGVAGFILGGFEHCVADMFYFAMASMFTGKALLALLAITLGNVAGGILFPFFKHFSRA